MNAVHDLSKAQIKRFAIERRRAGAYFDIGQPNLEDNFRGSIDRFCEIAYRFRNYPSVLDAGSGDGLLVALLKMLGHRVCAIDLADHSRNTLYEKHSIELVLCNVEADPLPFASDSFDALSCCQALEHFTHSHLPPVVEMRRVLRAGGLIELDVPNAVSFRNRSRMLRGKHITYEYKRHYLLERPIVYKGREYYPLRHNREFTKQDLEVLLGEAGFKEIEVGYLKSRRYREGLERVKSVGTAVKDSIPSLRKSLIAFARK